MLQTMPQAAGAMSASAQRALTTVTIRVRASLRNASPVKSVVVEFVRNGTGRFGGHAVVDLRSGAAACTSLGNAMVCQTSVKIAADDYHAAISTYEGYGGSGKPVALHQYESLVLGSPQSVVRLSVSGPVASLRVTPVSDNVTAPGNQLAVTTPASAAAALFVAPMDADANRILGDAVPTIEVVSRNPAFFKGRVTVTPAGLAQIALPSRLATASTVLTLSAPNVRATRTLAYNPFGSDDWYTFAHDQLRTAFESQPTAIVASNVKRLSARWKFENRWRGKFYGSPIVYRGNVIIVDTDGNVIDLSATDGSVRWHTALPQAPKQNEHINFVASTPTIDAEDGLLFIGTRTYFAYPAPSYFFALHLSDGSIAWRKKLGGLLRSAPVYGAGMVFEGTSGGDGPPIGKCANGGVTAMDAKTGAVRWTWLVNPWTNPGGGGSVWGALAFDGAHVIFGTGNPCGEIVPTSQGAVSLNLNGKMAWSFVANDVAGSDNDTGGGVTIAGNDALFFSKDGSLYDVDAATGKEQWSAGFGSSSGLGGFASPATDGSVVIVGAGVIPSTNEAWNHVLDGTACLITQPWRQPGPKTGFGSAIDAVDRNGHVLWSRKMSAAEAGYVAMSGSIAYANLDDAMYALDTQTGRVLWSYRGTTNFLPSAAIVPSGLYAADQLNVYAFSPSQ